MAWNDDLLSEQEKAASHLGSHACMLAGPGTGKTLALTRRVLFLIEEHGIFPSEILVLTFTRAAAAELRGRISDVLNNHEELPQISTLHAFALRQLVVNSHVVDRLPSPVRVADDWEERNVILEDLKSRLSYGIEDVRDRFLELSNDWDTLKADNPAWHEKFVDPTFLGAWREHRTIYGYTMRSELVYQVKRSLEQSGNFKLGSNFTHILVDEYQDLNLCDLAVIRAIVNLGPELFTTGDDDQSIYGFRHAHPDGIRKFDKDHTPSKLLSLSTCMRCDRSIIRLAEFVADLDPDRLSKDLNPHPDAGEGQVKIFRFEDQTKEADAVARLCEFLINDHGCTFGDILILLRNDHNGAYSKPICEALLNHDIPVSPETDNPMDLDDGRRLKSILHLIADPDDSLSIRTWLQLRQGIGYKTINALYEYAQQLNCRFAGAAQSVQRDESVLPQFGGSIKVEMDRLTELRTVEFPHFEGIGDSTDSNELLVALERLGAAVIGQSDSQSHVMGYLQQMVKAAGVSTLRELLTMLSASDARIEPAIGDRGINIMTMHKAKGLTAEAVIVVAAEDEVIPGQKDGPDEADERRLLYVSLTRAKKHLFVTYCDRRTGQQQYKGSKAKGKRRNLTKFLQDAPIRPQPFEAFLAGFL